MNGDDESVFPQAKKIVIFKALVKNVGEERGDGVISFKQKENGRGVLSRADIGIKLVSEVLEQRCFFFVCCVHGGGKS